MTNKMDNITVAVITVSDRSFKNERPDLSGPALCSAVSDLGWKVATSDIVSDDPLEIEKILRHMIAQSEINLILTTGGTGLSPRDNTPEVTSKIIEKSIPGLSEHIRATGFINTPNALLSRAVSGYANGKLIINLPGSPTGAVESLKSVSEVIPHALEMMQQMDTHIKKSFVSHIK